MFSASRYSVLANRIGWKDTSSEIVSCTKSEGPARNHGSSSTPVSAPVATVRRQPNGRHTSRIGSSSARCCLLAQASASGITAHQARSWRTRTAHHTMPASSSGSVHAWSTWVSVPGASSRSATTGPADHAAARARTPPRPSSRKPAMATSVHASRAQRTSPASHRPGASSTAVHGR